MMQLYVEKDTDLMRSTFVAIGLANLMYQLTPAQSGVEIRLWDLGSCYAIDVPYSADDAHTYLARRGLPQILPALIKEFSSGEQKEIDKDPASPIQHKYQPRGFPSAAVANYKAEKAKMDAARADKKKERQEGDIAVRHNDYPVWAHLCSYFGKGSVMRSIYPGALHTWWAHQGQSADQLLDLIFVLYGQLPNDYPGAVEHWSSHIQSALAGADIKITPLLTASSAVSPTTVQGNNRVAVGLNLNNGSLDSFWLEMYLALAGYMVAGMPYRSGSDLVLYYPLPANISMGRLRSEASTYRQSSDTRRLYDQYSIERGKLDALAYLNYYEVLVQTLAAQADDIFDDEEERLTGLVGYYYKENGGTQIPFDETIFALPRWLDIQHSDVALDLLQAHKKIISSIRGPRYELTSDELSLVGAYRQFITTGGSEAWIDFAIRHHFYRFHRMDDAQFFVPDLSRSVFEETLMAIQTDKKDYRPIIENAGFQAVASAIRACTVTERYYQSVRNQNRSFKVRHGLGDDLLRHAHDSERFLEALGSFLHDYARESSNVQANTGETRAFVTTDHIAAVIGLVNDYGSRIVAHLLVAVGYASDYRKADQE